MLIATTARQRSSGASSKGRPVCPQTTPAPVANSRFPVKETDTKARAAESEEIQDIYKAAAPIVHL